MPNAFYCAPANDSKIQNTFALCINSIKSKDINQWPNLNLSRIFFRECDFLLFLLLLFNLYVYTATTRADSTHADKTRRVDEANNKCTGGESRIFIFSCSFRKRRVECSRALCQCSCLKHHIYIFHFYWRTFEWKRMPKSRYAHKVMANGANTFRVVFWTTQQSRNEF